MQTNLLSENKRIQLHQQIKKKHRNEIMQKMRYNQQNLIKKKILKDIIQQNSLQIYLRNKNKTLSHQKQLQKPIITEDQLKLLLNLISRKSSNAVIHLGNLLIDGAVNYKNFGLLYDQLQINENDENFQWLIYALGQRQFEFTPFLYQKLTSKIIQYAEQQSLFENQIVSRKILFSIKTIASALNKDNFSQILFQIISQNANKNTSSLIKLYYHQNSQIRRQALICLRRIVCFNKQIAALIYNSISNQKWQNFIISVLMSVSAKQRGIGIQIANNFVCAQVFNGQTPKIILKKLLNYVTKQKISIQVQISYYISNYLQTRGLIDYFEYKDFQQILTCVELFEQQNNSSLQANIKDIYRMLSHPYLQQKYPYLLDLASSQCKYFMIQNQQNNSQMEIDF